MATKAELIIPEACAGIDSTTQEYVYHRLRHAIMVGSLQPGTALTMRGLAEALGLSPTPIREAVRRLSSENAIQIKINRRITIPQMTMGRFEELVALRIALETHAAERALPYVSDIRIDEMTALDDEMDQAIGKDNLDHLTILNQDFHRILYSLNPNQVSMPAIESVWLQLGPFQRQVLELLEEYYQVDRHKEILAALRSRDVVALVNAIESDVRECTWRAGRKLLTSRVDGTHGKIS